MELTINKNKFKVKTVISSKDTSQGMMNKRFDDTFNGMLFIMSEGQHCFWMKNCIISLDIIMIEDDVITKIHHNCPPCSTERCKRYCGDGNLVLEVVGGTCDKHNINEGDVINLNK